VEKTEEEAGPEVGMTEDSEADTEAGGRRVAGHGVAAGAAVITPAIAVSIAAASIEADSTKLSWREASIFVFFSSFHLYFSLVCCILYYVTFLSLIFVKNVISFL
jgi:hypothetical protein